MLVWNINGIKKDIDSKKQFSISNHVATSIVNRQWNSPVRFRDHIPAATNPCFLPPAVSRCIHSLIEREKSKKRNGMYAERIMIQEQESNRKKTDQSTCMHN